MPTPGWPQAEILLLRTLWADRTLSAAEIGRRMARSKGSIVGMVHRIGLPARPSPIRPAVAQRPKRADRSTLSPATSDVGADAAETPSATVSAAERDPASPPASASRAASDPVPASPCGARFVARRAADCCWPIGDPGAPGFRFCDAAAEQGRPYCAEHAQVAYVRMPARREAEASA